MKNIYNYKYFLLLFSPFITLCCKGNAGNSSVVNPTEDSVYTNPVDTNISLPDPTVIRANNGYYYLYATESIHNVPIMKSKDMVHWNLIGTVFTNVTRPTFTVGGIWAPYIAYVNGQYVLYYTLSGGDDVWKSGIGVATSDNPEGPFIDKGKMFLSSEIGVEHSIDPCYIKDNGKNYLIWGSACGIYIVELTDDGLKVSSGVKPVQIAGTAFEGSYVFKRGDYYYYCGSVGCWDKKYEVGIGRSKSLFGPYLNKEGKSLMDNNYDLFIGSNSYFIRNGGNSQIVQDDAGKDWIFYHGYINSTGKGRFLMLSAVKWYDEWPYIIDDSPQLTSTVPVINR